jgi:hypothetical protein
MKKERRRSLSISTPRAPRTFRSGPAATLSARLITSLSGISGIKKGDRKMEGYKVYWRNVKGGSRTWKLSASTKKPVSLDEAKIIYTRYVEVHGCEAKIKEQLNKEAK